MPDLQRLRADHAGAVLEFETVNRAYFALSVSDRGDAYFTHFPEHYDALLAELAAGRGLATDVVRELCRFAASRHGLATLRAATSHANVASRRVLTKAGFVEIGDAGPADLGGKPGSWFELGLPVS